MATRKYKLRGRTRRRVKRQHRTRGGSATIAERAKSHFDTFKRVGKMSSSVAQIYRNALQPNVNIQLSDARDNLKSAQDKLDTMNQLENKRVQTEQAKITKQKAVLLGIQSKLSSLNFKMAPARKSK
tara:strand:- start:6659 stop:7039 length:381 start_codon:yes stop_codon:yes gene_type:complete